MNESWDEYRRKLREQIPPAMVSLASEAKLSNCWIYRHSTKKWYTPEEFIEEARVLYSQHRNRDNIKDFAVMDPMAGLKARIDAMKKVSDEIISFQNRIDDYFSIELKAKKPGNIG